MKKVKYEIDPHNRLVVEETVLKKKGKVTQLRKTRLPRFRRVLDGRFKLSKDNSLSYHVKAPTPGDADIPHQLKLKGKWSLTNKHNLRLTLDKWGRQTFGDQLTLRGDIVDVGKNSLSFALTTETKDNIRSRYILKLQGSWQADKNNRITFKVKKDQARHDILTFDGIWKINKNHQIVYQYKKADLIRKSKKIHTLTFKGHWDIQNKARILYIIDKNTDSVFSFSPSIGIFKKSYIKYEIGIRFTRRARPTKQTVALLGTWKISKGTGLTFQVKYEDKNLPAISFGAYAKLTGKNTISLRLKNKVNKDLGAELKLSRKILKGDGEAFLKLVRSSEESAIYIGAGWGW